MNLDYVREVVRGTPSQGVDFSRAKRTAEKKRKAEEHNRLYAKGKVKTGPRILVATPGVNMRELRIQLAKMKKDATKQKIAKTRKDHEAIRRKNESINAGAARILSLVTRVTEKGLP